MAAAAATGMQAPRIYSPASTKFHWRENAAEPRRRVVFAHESGVSTGPSSGGRCFRIAATKPQNDEVNSNADEPDTSYISQVDEQEDLNFLLKLGGGSFIAAAAIKYGSILFPEITKPNIIQALVMISTPVVVAVLLLIKASRVQQ